MMTLVVLLMLGQEPAAPFPASLQASYVDGPEHEKCQQFVDTLDGLLAQIRRDLPTEGEYLLVAGTVWDKEGRAVYFTELACGYRKTRWQIPVRLSTPVEAANDMAKNIRIALAGTETAGHD